MNRTPEVGDISVGDEIFYRAFKNTTATVESIQTDGKWPYYHCDNGKRVPHSAVIEHFPTKSQGADSP